VISHRSRLASTCAALVVSLSFACIAPQRPDDVLVLASGADLESANPLVTTHTLARQIQRYALLVTLTRYDSSLVHQPYFARRWSWSGDRRALTMSLAGDLLWHDGTRTTARDAAFTLLAARDPATGFPRAAELASLDTAVAVDDTTLLLHFGTPTADLPPYLAELPVAPAHLLASLPRSALRSATYNDAPIGNGPFRFVSRRRGARWTFRSQRTIPGVAWRTAGAARAHGCRRGRGDDEVRRTRQRRARHGGNLADDGRPGATRRDARRADLSGAVRHGALLQHDAPTVRRRARSLAVSRAIDRARIVEVALAGFGTPWAGPVPPDNPLAWSPRAVYDTAAADSLLDAAGWRRERGLACAGAAGRRSPSSC
jgi:peptide/nickel transport system substrate-binding protein